MSSTSTTPTSQSGIARIVLSSVVGTAIEWYDFFLYATASALIFNHLFFPDFDPTAGTIAAFGTFAVGYVARPIGAIAFGHLGDRVGRKSALVTTLMIMGVCTCIIGLLPTYASIGVWAPVLLIALRFCQGLAVGGEWGGERYSLSWSLRQRIAAASTAPFLKLACPSGLSSRPSYSSSLLAYRKRNSSHGAGEFPSYLASHLSRLAFSFGLTLTSRQLSPHCARKMALPNHL